MSRADRVEGVVTAAGTGPVTLAATPPTGRQGLAAIGSTGATFTYSLEQDAAWELGTGTITGANTFSRVPAKSSAGGAVVSFTAGAKFAHTIRASEFDAFLSAADGITLDTYLTQNPGSSASGTDVLPMTQGGALKGITAAVLGAYVLDQITSARTPSAVISATTPVPLDFTTHNRRILVCTAAANIIGPTVYGSVGDGFECQVSNRSSGVVTFGSGISCLPSGTTLSAGQSARLYSQGGAIYAHLPVAGTPAVAAAAVTSFAAGTIASSTIPTTWVASASGTAPITYTAQYRVTTTTPWLTAAAGLTGTSYTYSGLTSATSFDLRILAVNAADSIASATVVASTIAGASVPNQGTTPTAGTITSNSVAFNWAAPASGAAPTSYTPEYRAVGAGSWTALASTASLTATATGLTASTPYEFRNTPVNGAGAGAPSDALSASTIAAASTGAVIVPTARAGFPIDAKTYVALSGLGYHDITRDAATVSAGVTITAVEWALSQSNTVYPTGTINGTTTPRGLKNTASLYPANNTSGVYILDGFNVNFGCPADTPFYFWMKITDSAGEAHYYRRNEVVNVLDNRAALTQTSATSTHPKVAQ